MKNKSNFITIFIFLIVAGLACADGGDGGARQSNQGTGGTSDQNQNTIRNLSSAPTAAAAPPLSSPPPAPDKSNTAIVISRHANLRDADSAGATVLEVIPQDASVEVIKQQGAWFLVKTETAQGWMHGNTLKLQSFDVNPNLPLTARRPPQPQPTPEPALDNAGATARCRDGSLSYSAHRRGTCSHHGGVAVWY